MKRQNINLYHAEFRREKSWLTLRVASFASIAVVALVSVLATKMQLEHQHTSAEKQRLESQLAVVKTEVATLKKTMKEKGVKPEVLSRINEVKAVLKAKENMMNSLGLQSENTFKGFSPYMLALGKQHVKGLWLTDFHVSEVKQELILMGKMRRAELLPRYLKGLSTENVFQGRTFNSFRIAEVEKSQQRNVLDFIVTTHEEVKPLSDLLAVGD